MGILEIVSGVKLVADTLKAATGILKDGKELLPQGEDKKAIENKLVDVEKTLDLASVQMAQVASGLGYKLCLAHYPPKIMIKTGEDSETLQPIFRCQECGEQEPSKAQLERASANGRGYIAKVKRGWDFFDET